MSRLARKKSTTGIYHVMLRGADRRIIFSDDEDCEHLEDNGSSRLTDQEAIKKICDLCSCTNTQEIGGWNEERRDNAVITVIRDTSVSIRQLSRLTGISKAIIERICRK